MRRAKTGENRSQGKQQSPPDHRHVSDFELSTPPKSRSAACVLAPSYTQTVNVPLLSLLTHLFDFRETRRLVEGGSYSAG